jgi:hypothetical protein
VGISYDTPEILKSFADRRKIEFPLLSDPDSKIIRAYGVLNDEATGQFQGMARPGFFFIDPSGVIREKFFEAKYRERLSGNNLIAKMFPELGEEVSNTVEAPHLKLALEQSDPIAFPGERVTLTAEVRLPAGVHVYAPGAKDYKPVHLGIEAPAGWPLQAAVYPKSQVLFLPAIKERVPVFEGTFRIRQDLQVSTAAAFSGSIGADGQTFTVTGKLAYQACDEKICYLPTSVPVQWKVQVMPLDRQRAPEEIRHK